MHDIEQEIRCQADFRRVARTNGTLRKTEGLAGATGDESQEFFSGPAVIAVQRLLAVVFHLNRRFAFISGRANPAPDVLR